VVHGPLNLINMLDLWRDSQEDDDHAIPQSIDYRATSTLYVGDQYRTVMEKTENGGSANLSIYASSGEVSMRGEITTF
jgi:hydroxyacyl-ACP dehydratase HTD2-like protein with hotdog domain